MSSECRWNWRNGEFGFPDGREEVSMETMAREGWLEIAQKEQTVLLLQHHMTMVHLSHFTHVRNAYHMQY